MQQPQLQGSALLWFAVNASKAYCVSQQQQCLGRTSDRLAIPIITLLPSPLHASLSIHSPKSNFSGKCQMVEGKCFVPLSVKLSFKAASEKCISKGGKLFEPREESINFQVLTAAWKGRRTFKPRNFQPHCMLQPQTFQTRTLQP